MDTAAVRCAGARRTWSTRHTKGASTAPYRASHQLPGHLARRRARARPCVRPTTARPARGLDARVGGGELRRERVRARSPRRRARTASRRSPSSAAGWTPTGVASTGTSQASASSTARPKPSRVGRDEHGVGGVDPVAAPRRAGRRPSVSSCARRRGHLARAVGALPRPRRVGGEEHERPVGVEAQRARAPRRAGSGRKRSRSTPHGQHRDARARPGAADVRAASVARRPRRRGPCAAAPRA